MAKKLNVGGQAVIEGVMMKTDNNLAICVRNEKGKIITKKDKLKKKNKFFKLPFIRGILNLIEMMVLGIKGLIWSGNQVMEEEEEFTVKELVFVLTTSMLFVVGFFIVLPYYLTKLVVDKGFLFNLIDGAIRILVFIAYILIISLMDDVRRLFQNHGAEHKAVNCYESDKPLTVQNAKKFSTLHIRCGTSFIIIVLIIAIVIFSVITTEIWWMNLLLRVLLIPVIASVSYELLKLSAKHEKNIIVRALTAPGIWLQKITTRKPDTKQVEVAVRVLKTVLQMEKLK